MTTAETTTAETSSRAPRPDVGTLLSGALFTALGVAFMLEAAGTWTFRLTGLRVLGPVVLILLGVAVLASAAMQRHSAS